MAAPLFQLQRKGAPFVWGEAQEKAFNNLKAALTSSPVLRYPDFSKPFTLVTDASDVGLGAALLQNEGRRDHAVAYASRTLTKEEKNYSATEREALAVVWALKHFRDTIYNYPVHVLTDHQPLISLFKNKNPVGKFARYFLTIQEFNPTFGYIPGKQNVVADAFSRQVAAVQVDYPALDATEVETEQRQDPLWSPIIRYLTKQDTRPVHKPPVPLKELTMINNLLCRIVKLGTPPRKCYQLVVPTVLVPAVLKIIHDSPARAHPGKDRTLQQGRLKYFWLKMAKEVGHYVDRCLVCLAHRGHVTGPNPIQVYPATSVPWERVSMDLLTNFAETEKGNKHLLVMVDNFSRYCELVPIKDKTAETIASAFHDQIICRYSMPKVILSDNGLEFNNSILDKLCKLYHIKKCNIMPYHPASNGLAERTNRKVLDALRVIINFDNTDWDEVMPVVQCAINSSINASIGDTPHAILFGTDKKLPDDLINAPIAPLYNSDNYVQAKRRHMQFVFKKVKEHLSNATAEFTRTRNAQAKPSKIKVGSLVMILNRHRSGPMYKLVKKFLGPYKVVELIKGNKYKLKNLTTGEYINEHLDHMKLAKITIDETETDTEDVNDISQPDSSNVTPSTTVDRPLDAELPVINNYNLRSRPLVSTVELPRIPYLDSDETGQNQRVLNSRDEQLPSNDLSDPTHQSGTEMYRILDELRVDIRGIYS